MKIAIVHDYLTQNGGAENVLKAISNIYPKAPIYSLFYNSEEIGGLFHEKKIKTSFIQKMPFKKKHYQWYLPLMPLAIEKYNLSDYDIVISSTSAFAKGIITNTNTLHICYCHTPTRYLWTDANSYVNELPYNKFIKIFIPFLLFKLRMWDRLAADRVDKFITNSFNVAKRIKKFYHRKAEIIYPPINIDKYYISRKLGNYYLIGGRIVSYKRYDLAIKVFNRLKIPLKIFGNGPGLKKLKKQAGDNIEFLGRISEKEKRELFSKCIAFIHPQEEDFGITAVEAMASGRPVIAYKKGGALETIVENITGKFFLEQTWESLLNVIVNFRPKQFDSYKIREYSKKFSVERFKKEFSKMVDYEWENFSKAGSGSYPAS